jgi:hypothetical protein
MSTVQDYKVMKDGEWEEASKAVWVTHTGLRKMNVLGYQIGWVGYHGPCYEPSGKVSRAIRECRCTSCTMFEESRYEGLSDGLRHIVDSMLLRVDNLDTPGVMPVNGVADHDGVPENNEDVEDVSSPNNLGGVSMALPDMDKNNDAADDQAHLEQEEVADPKV